MRDKLTLRFEPDDDGTGELFAEVRSAGFAGLGSAWFGTSQLVAFGERLRDTYPLPSDEPFNIEGGFWETGEHSMKQRHVGLNFYPIGQVGLVGCRVQLMTPLYEHDRPNQQHEVAVELTTQYEQLRLFGEALMMLARGEIDEATLGPDA